MKYSMWLASLLILGLVAIPQAGLTAIAQPLPPKPDWQQQEAHFGGKPKKQLSFKEKIAAKADKVKEKVKRGWDKFQMTFPTGKLLTSLVLLLASIVLFAIGGVVSISSLLYALGSVAVIGALVFFVLWLSERSKVPRPTN